MNTLADRSRIVKACAILFSPEMLRGLHNPAFGRMPQRDRKLPVGPSAADARWVAETMNSGGVTEEEVADEMARRTMSAAQYAEFKAEAAEMARERLASVDVQDASEIGMSDADFDLAIARDAAEWDATFGYTVEAPVPARKVRRRRVDAAKARRLAVAR